MLNIPENIKNSDIDVELAESLYLLQEHKNIMSMITDYEQKNMTPTEEGMFFQYLFDSGLVWTMPNSYITRVMDMLEKNMLYFN